MTPLEQYHEDLYSGKIKTDSSQERAVAALQHIYFQLNNKPTVLSKIFTKKPAVKGLYMWGPVGTGKTYLLDLFYNSFPTNKLRMHFYEFMKRIHAQLKELVGIKNPLDKVAEELAEQYKVICFDEFFVSNIVDAMILGNLLKALFKKGLCLVTTSNIIPDRLYEDGLQRESFLPAIAALKDNIDVIEVNNHTDYRLRQLTHANTYFYPINEQTNEYMQAQFQQFSRGTIKSNSLVTILKRDIFCLKVSDNAIWFDFNTLCQSPRSQLDYLELVKQYDYLFISGIRHFTEKDNDAAVLFISLIDVVYNAHKKMFLLANCSLNHLYEEGELAFPFKRIHSRLMEMQSQEYLDIKP